MFNDGTQSAPGIEKLADQDGPAEWGYASWKRGKVETGLEQFKKRDNMIPAGKVWRELYLEH